MEEQRRLEMEETGFDDQTFEEDDVAIETEAPTPEAASCPICSVSLDGASEQDASTHVNNCLDGNPTPLPEKKPTTPISDGAARFKRPPPPPKPAQESPFALGEAPGAAGSAFSKLMSGKAEDAAWAAASAAENASRGKPAYTRTCPFYKIMPAFNICVDAFRYGAVKGCNAYFLSHFHSDHYIGLTASWTHGPIYCSKVTGNLVRQQLRVDQQYVVDLDWETPTLVPGTNGVLVTMISANHCPGSSLFLFEKELQGHTPQKPKLQRVLHCGDFRACPAHIEHPFLMPDIVDQVTRKNRQQKIDVCYLDTTYLNPKYAFPGQEEVIKACADMCVSLNKVSPDESDGWEQMKRARAGEGMTKFVRKDSNPAIKQEEDEADTSGMKVMQNGKLGSERGRGRLLVVVGTYSIGKERICLGIARALKSKIFAPTGKQRIVRALEDPELQALMTTNPREAQVHMTPLFEIRADTLDEYLMEYADSFGRCVGFRPSGWQYRPPNSRFVESPSVQTVLHSKNWHSGFSMKELVPQRGSTSRASCFGVPYSEHSSFRELTMFCCALRIEKIVPTVNVGSAKSRERMKQWIERWGVERRKNGLFKLGCGTEW
ncbi:DNA repair metallo-beta-lactamase-domain-containing protein [Delphinella strobiligena]|nr:DNA repair metallo-beta-lactamase-domain-containing protein [Delphinella strobiligena]